MRDGGAELGLKWEGSHQTLMTPLTVDSPINVAGRATRNHKHSIPLSDFPLRLIRKVILSVLRVSAL